MSLNQPVVIVKPGALEVGPPGAPGDGTGGASLPNGGTTGQALVKASNANQDVAWGTVSADGGGGAVSSVDGQVGVVNLSSVYQGKDSDLSSIAALNSATANVIASDGSGWIAKTYAQFKSALGLTKSDVGLGNVDNTSDVNKPVSSAQAAINAAKADLVGGKVPTSQLPAITIGETFTVNSQSAMLALTAQIGDVAIRTDQSNAKFLLLGTDPTVISNWQSFVSTGNVTSVNSQTGVVVLGKTDIGLDQVDNTSDANKPISTVQASALAGKQPIDTDLTTIAGLDATTAGVMATSGSGWFRQTYAAFKTSLSLVKADVGLGSVDNTADSAKPISTLQQAGLDTKISKALVDAKGDLLVATADDTPARLPVGSNGQVLQADSTQTAGIKWADAGSTADPTEITYSDSPYTTITNQQVILVTTGTNDVVVKIDKDKTIHSIKKIDNGVGRVIVQAATATKLVDGLASYTITDYQQSQAFVGRASGDVAIV